MCPRPYIKPNQMTSSSSSSDAIIELTLLSINLFKTPNPLLSKSTFVVASIHDSTKTLTPKYPIHFPLSSRALQNPCSTQISIQIVSSRFPFRAARLLAADSITLSAVHLAGDVRTLNMLKPSGKMYGTLKVSLRVLWVLGPASDCQRLNLGDEKSNLSFNEIAGPITPPISLCHNVGAFNEVSQCNYDFVPTAPPISEFYNVGGLGETSMSEMMEIEGSNSQFSYVLGPTAPQPSGSSDVDSVHCNVVRRGELEEESGGGECKCVHNKVLEKKSNGDKGGAWRSFLVGLVSGSLAVVLVGVSSLIEG